MRALESQAYEKKKAKKKKEKEAAQMAKLLGIAKDEAKIVSWRGAHVTKMTNKS